MFAEDRSSCCSEHYTFGFPGFNAERVILSRVQVLAPMVLKLRSIPMPAEIGYSLRRGRGGSLDCMWGVQTHSGPPVFLVPFHKDLARINGTPQPNRK